jgi:hypothetical protein
MEHTAAKANPHPPSNQATSPAPSMGSKVPTTSTGIKTARSRRGNFTVRISDVAWRVCIYSDRPVSLTGPYSTRNPVAFLTSWAVIPGAPNSGSISTRRETTSARRVSCTRWINSSVPNVPLPAAYHTFTPKVPRTRI